VTKLFAAVLTESASLSSGEIFTTFGSNRPVEAWNNRHALEDGVIKLAANGGQFSPMKPQWRWKTDKIGCPIMGLKSVIASAFADLAKQGESRLSSCLEKINSTDETKCKYGNVNEIVGRIQFAS